MMLYQILLLQQHSNRIGGGSAHGLAYRWGDEGGHKLDVPKTSFGKKETNKMWWDQDPTLETFRVRVILGS